MARIPSERTSVTSTGSPLASRLAEYVRGVAHAEGMVAARRRAAHLGLFFAYLQQRGLNDLGLPWWEYVAALEWIRRRAHGSWAASGRVVDTLRAFYASLAPGAREPVWELERAAAILRGGRALRRFATLACTGPETWRLWRTAEGRLGAVSFADRWLGLLWSRNERSWAAVARRLRTSAVAAPGLAALRALRARIDTGHCPDPGHLAVGPVRPAELEALSAWLGGPSAPGLPRTRTDQALGAHTTAALVDRLAASTAASMPRQEMAELRRRGDNAAAALVPLLRGERDAATPLWAIVVLGELRAVQASDALATWLGAADAAVAEAAAEALARIGRGALPAVLNATRGHHGERLHAWAALGAMHGQRAHQALRRGLGQDPHFVDVIARALARHGRRDAIPVLHGHTAPAPIRRVLEAAIFTLVHGASPREPFEADWRLRYRPLPALGGRFPWGWTGIAALAHRRLERERPTGSPEPMRPLATILADPRLLPDDLARCHRCGGRTWRPTGLRSCRHTAEPVVKLQRAALARARAAGCEDAWSALDACDAHETALARPATHARATIAVERASLYWLITRGVEDLAAGERLLALAADELATLYRSLASDPEVAAGRGR